MSPQAATAGNKQLEYEAKLVGIALAYPGLIGSLAERLTGYRFASSRAEASWRAVLAIDPVALELSNTPASDVAELLGRNGNPGWSAAQLEKLSSPESERGWPPSKAALDLLILQLRQANTWQQLREAVLTDDPRRGLEEARRILDSVPAQRRRDRLTKAILWGEALELADLEEVEPVLGDGLLVRGQYGVLCGEKGTGKSWVACELALAVAQGRPFYGLQTKPVRVLYLSLELPRSEVLKRLHKIHGPKLPENLGVVGTDTYRATDANPDPPTYPKLLLPEVQEELQDAIRNGPVDLLILDPVSRTVQGDENAELGLIADYINRLTIAENIAGFAAHHPPKTNAGSGRKGAHAVSRGDSRFTDWACVVLELQERRGARKLACAEGNGPRYCAEPEPIWLRRTASGRLEQCEAPEDASAKADVVRATLRDLLDEKGIVYPAQEATRLGYTAQTIRRHLKAIGAVPTGAGAGAAWTLAGESPQQELGQ